MAKTFTYTSGNKTIKNYNGGDVIKISAKKISSYSFSGNDLVFKIGKGTLTLKDMKGRAVTIENSAGKTSTKIYGTGYSVQEVIKNLVKAWNESMLDGTAKLDESIRLCSQFDGIQDVIDNMVADCKKAGDADTFLKKYCGIILDNDDTGAITGWDAGGLNVKTTDDIIPETSAVKKIKNYSNTSFVRDNVTINIAENLDSLTAKGKKVLNGLYSWWAEESLNLIEESYGVEFEEGDTINFSLVQNASFWGRTTDDSVKIALNYTKFTGSDDYNGNGVDRIIAHEFTHIAQNLFMGRFPQFLAEGLAELTCGADHRRSSVIKTLAGSPSKLKKYLDVDNYSTGSSNYYAAGYMFYRYLAKQAADSFDSKKNYAWTGKIIINGTSKSEFLTGNGKNSTINGSNGNDTISAYGDKMKIFGDKGNDLILSNGNKIKISGGNGKDIIKNRGDNSSLAGDAGNDFIINGEYWENELGGKKVTISGGTGNDTITSNGNNSRLDGGAGDDLIYNGYRYYEDWDYFYNYNDENFSGKNSSVFGGAGNDTISNQGNFVTISGGAGKNIISNGTSNYVGGKKVSIAGGSDAESITNYGGSFITIRSGSGNDTINNIHTVNYADYNQSTKKYDTIETIYPANVTIDAGNGNDYIFNDGDKVSINGGKGNDSIVSSGANVTINGGKGNNLLWGSSDADTFIYSGGDDIIFNFDGKDTLTFDNIDFKTSYNKKNQAVTFNFDDGSVILKDFTAKTFHINDEIYKISGNKFVKK